MKIVRILAVLLVIAAPLFAQSSTVTLDSPADYFRFQRNVAPARTYDVTISGGGLFNLLTNGVSHIYFGPEREVVINRLAGNESVLTVNGANNVATDHYVTSMWINTGSTNPAATLYWNVGTRTRSPVNKTTIAGWSIAHFTENFAQPNGAGHAYWYEGPVEGEASYVWNVDGYGNSWSYRVDPLHHANWERGGCYWDKNEAEFYCGTQAANGGTLRPFALVGSKVAIDAPLHVESTVVVQGQPAFTGQCPKGQKPYFVEGIAVRCQ